jgi:hypothetical protein
MANTMANPLVSLGNEMQRLSAATAAARKAVDEAVRQLERAEKDEKEFARKLSALAGTVVSVTTQNTQVTATTSAAASSAAPASGASGASGAASNGGVGTQSAVTSEQRFPKGAPKKKQVLQKKRANTDWRRFLPRPINTEWATGVDRWFSEHAVDHYSFLTTDGLAKKTVQLMAKFSIDVVMSVMEKSKWAPYWMKGKGGRGLSDCRPRDMRGFVRILSGNLQYLQDNPDAQRDAQTSAQATVDKPSDHAVHPDAQRDAQTSAQATVYKPFDHAAAHAHFCRHS